jgi:hypothetical protein
MSLLRAHLSDDEAWGRVLLCREEIDDLRADLTRHRRDVCKHYIQQREEYKLRKLSET